MLVRARNLGKNLQEKDHLGIGSSRLSLGMEPAIRIWNLLWDYQVYFAFVEILLFWLIIRGTDLVRWIRRKIRKEKKDTG